MLRNSAWSYLLFILYCCTSIEENNDAVTIHVNQSGASDFPWDQVVEKADVIRLETNRECLLTKITKLVVHDEKLFIFDSKLDELFIFGLDGRFQKKLNKKGEGPEEYKEMRDVEIDKDGNIFILDFNRIIKYSPDFSYLNEIRYDYLNKTDGPYINPLQFALLDEYVYLWSGSMGIFSNEGGIHKSLYKIDDNGKIVSSWFPVEKKLFGDPVFSRAIDGTLLLTPDYSAYTIYSLSSSGVTTKYSIDFGEHKAPDNRLRKSFDDSDSYFKILNETDYAINVSLVSESIDHLYFIYFQKDRVRTGLYSKSTQNLITGKVWLNPYCSPYLMYQKDNFFYGYIDAHDYISLNTLSSGFQKINDVQPDENPLIIKVKFNEF